MALEFRKFPKLSRLSRPVIVTEKIDGTNALVAIDEAGNVQAGSRTRWVVPGDDNYGFASWVYENQDDLRTLGEGYHYGEWWGKGIQRNYALPERRFSLFNVSRWGDNTVRPKCCSVVPTLCELPSLDIYALKDALKILMEVGSSAAPGFMNPEGVVAFHTHSHHTYKMTLDDNAKGE